MSMPRYTCIESSETISTSPSPAATASATADLPDAVGPTMARWRVRSHHRNRDADTASGRGLDARDQIGPQEVGRGTRDAHLDQLAGACAIGGNEVDELVLAGAARPH